MSRLITSPLDSVALLHKYKHIAMVGLSANPYRPSHFAAIYMLSEGYDIIPVNPREREILGRDCYPSLTEAAKDHPVEIVDIFRNPKDVPPIVEEAIAVGAKVVWMQLGVINEAAAQRAIDAGLDVVMDRCVKLEHARFHGGQNLIGLNTGVVSARRHRSPSP
jgi:predicted CoA-binding protein